MYQTVRDVLKKYGVKGTTFQTLMEKTELSKDQLYQVIGQGFRCRGIECFEVNGEKMYRNRLRNEQLYGANEAAILSEK